MRGYERAESERTIERENEREEREKGSGAGWRGDARGREGLKGRERRERLEGVRTPWHVPITEDT